MKVYQKPSIVGDLDKESAIPFAAAVGKAALAGALAGLAKGKIAFDSNHTKILNARYKK